MMTKFDYSYVDNKTNNIITETVIGKLEKIFLKEEITPADVNSTEIYFTVGNSDYALNKIRSISFIKNSDEKHELNKIIGKTSVYDLDGSFVEFSSLFEKLSETIFGI